MKCLEIFKIFKFKPELLNSNIATDFHFVKVKLIGRHHLIAIIDGFVKHIAQIN